jgi:transposase
LWGWFADGGVMSRAAVLTDAQWQLIEPLMPSSDGKQGNQFS